MKNLLLLSIVACLINLSIQDKILGLSRLKTSDYFIAGGIGTALADILLFPLDTIKVKQQNSKTPLGTYEAFQTLVSENGFHSLFKGSIGYSLMDGIGSAMFFATYEIVKKLAARRLPGSLMGLSAYPSAAAAFAVSTVLLVPAEVIKTRMQTSSQFGSVWECLNDVTSSSNLGIQGLYQGYSAALARDMPFFVFQLGFYENIRAMLQRHVKLSTLSASASPGFRLSASVADLFSGVAAGVLTGLLTNPMDVVTSRLMAQSEIHRSARVKGEMDGCSSIDVRDECYTGFWDCVYRMAKEEGLGSFLSGVDSRIAWMAPFTAISLNVNELIKRGIIARKSRRNLGLSSALLR